MDKANVVLEMQEGVLSNEVSKHNKTRKRHSKLPKQNDVVEEIAEMMMQDVDNTEERYISASVNKLAEIAVEE